MMKKSRGIAGMTDTLVGKGTEIEGVLTTQAGVRIEGTFSGEIDAKGDVVIGAGGIARCNMKAQNITVAGQVHGDIHTNGKLTILSTGQVFGSLQVAVLAVEEGGQLNGTSTMERPENRSLASASPEAAPEQGKKTKQAG